jgi:dipeptidyl aminopeptidase/acylaminoacyl peptidase
MNADGSGQTELTVNADGDFNPAWSPDGSQIAFSSDAPGNIEIYTVRVNGRALRRLTFHPDIDLAPAWSPDGRQIAFYRVQGATDDVFVVDTDGESERNVTAGSDNDSHPSWYPLPTTRRALIGAAGSDGGNDPPFGAAKPMALVGLCGDGLVEAVSVGLGQAYWSTVKVAAMTDIGTDHAGMRIIANRINTVQEDRGRGFAPRVWDVSGTPRTGAVFVLFSGDDGRVTSVISSADQAFGADGASQVLGDRVVLRGEFPAVYSDRISGGGPASEVTIHRRTGEVVEVR